MARRRGRWRRLPGESPWRIDRSKGLQREENQYKIACFGRGDAFLSCLCQAPGIAACCQAQSRAHPRSQKAPISAAASPSTGPAVGEGARAVVSSARRVYRSLRRLHRHPPLTPPAVAAAVAAAVGRGGTPLTRQRTVYTADPDTPDPAALSTSCSTITLINDAFGLSLSSASSSAASDTPQSAARLCNAARRIEWHVWRVLLVLRT